MIYKAKGKCTEIRWESEVPKWQSPKKIDLTNGFGYVFELKLMNMERSERNT